MTDTGGELNRLNGKMGISAPYNSVPVMKLINQHNPKSHEELTGLIEKHIRGADCCDVISQGTVEDFGKNLFEAQEEFWGEIRYSQEECIQWEYDLFITQSLKGGKMEQKAISELKSELSEYGKINFKEANEFIDNKHRIDVEVFFGERLISGIQIKPNSYRKIRDEVKYRNKAANTKYDAEVFYLYYDYNSEEFENIQMILSKLECLI